MSSVYAFIGFLYLLLITTDSYKTTSVGSSKRAATTSGPKHHCRTVGTAVTQKTRRCECVLASSLLFRGAGPGFEDRRIWHCLNLGCRVPDSTNSFMKTGTVVLLPSRRMCKCIKGQDPFLADARSLAYMRCKTLTPAQHKTVSDMIPK